MLYTTVSRGPEEQRWMKKKKKKKDKHEFFMAKDSPLPSNQGNTCKYQHNYL